jgi:hypothetical protein
MITQEQKLQLLNKINVVVNELVNEWAIGQGDTPVISVTKQELEELRGLIEEATEAADNAESEASYAQGYAEEAMGNASTASCKASDATHNVNSLMSRFND